MPLIIGKGQSERFYLALKYKGEYLKTLAGGESVQFSSREPGVAVLTADYETVQDPAAGAAPTIASCLIEALEASPVEIVVTARFKRKDGQTDSYVQDTVKVVKGAQRSGSLFGNDVHIVAVKPNIPKTEAEIMQEATVDAATANAKAFAAAEPPPPEAPASPGKWNKKGKKRWHAPEQIAPAEFPAGTEPYTPAPDVPTT